MSVFKRIEGDSCVSLLVSVYLLSQSMVLVLVSHTGPLFFVCENARR